MKQIHLGIIGYGIQGSHYVKILCDEKRCPDIQVTAVFEIDENKRKQGMIDHPELSFFDDFEAMAKSGPRRKRSDPSQSLAMEEEEFNIPANAFKKIPFVSKKLETDGLNLQHAGVLDSFARKILYDEPFLFEGENGLNSLLLCNAIYLSSFLKQTIQFPFDEALYYELLKEKIVSSK